MPTYSVIDVTETSLTLNTYRTDTDEKIDTQFMIVKSADHSQLSGLIEEAGALKEDDYTADSFSALQQALEAAKTVNDNAQATEEELSNAYTALKSAMDALEKKATQGPADTEDPSDPSGTQGGTTDPTQDPTTQDPTTQDPTIQDPATQNPAGQTTDTKAPGINAKPQTTKPVQTGDSTNVVIPAAVLAAAAAIGGTTIYIRRKKK